jgi:hypothetical protein
MAVQNVSEIAAVISEMRIMTIEHVSLFASSKRLHTEIAVQEGTPG